MTDGSYPTLRRLLEQWFLRAFLSVATPLQILGLMSEDHNRSRTRS